MLLVLAFIGYSLAALLFLVLLVLAVCLASPFSFEARASLEIEPAATQGDATDEYLMALLGPDVESVVSRASTAGVCSTVSFYLRWLGGLLTVNEHGLRLAGRRLGGRNRKTAGDPARRRHAGVAPVGRGARRSRGNRRSQGEQSTKRLRRTRTRARRLGGLDLSTLRRLWPQVRKALGRSWAALHLRVRLHMALGLEDPAVAAMMSGWIEASCGTVTRAEPQGRRWNLRLTPVFDREMLAAEAYVAGRASAGALLWPWVRLALHRDVRKLWWPRLRGHATQKGGR